MSTPTTEPVSYDPYSFGMRDDPFETFRALRDHAPVYYNADRDLWVLSRFEDVRAAAKDWETFSSAQGVTIIRPEEKSEASVTQIPGNFLESDPPSHDQLRAVVRPRFTPRALKELEDVVAEISNELIDGFIADGEADLARQFGCELPSRVITHMLGLPKEDASKLSHLFHLVTDPPETGVGITDEAKQAMVEMGGYLYQAAEQRRADPRDDILSDLTKATIDGEPLGPAELGICFLLYAAGEDTTTALITTTIELLARHPDERRALVEDPSRIPGALEEILRYDGPFLHLTRVTTKDVTIRDVTIPADSRVLLLWSSANRDERQFDDPDTLDLGRKRVHHLGFGEGIHHCLGGPLARLEARIAMGILLQRIPEYEITGPTTRNAKLFIRGFHGLPATFAPRSS